MRHMQIVISTLAWMLLITDASATETAKQGQAIYNGTCIACHGADGTGSLPGVPDLNEKVGVLTKSDALLLRSLTDGVQGPNAPIAMPAKGGNPALTEDDLKAVLAYIRQNFQRK